MWVLATWETPPRQATDDKRARHTRTRRSSVHEPRESWEEARFNGSEVSAANWTDNLGRVRTQERAEIHVRLGSGKAAKERLRGSAIWRFRVSFCPSLEDEARVGAAQQALSRGERKGEGVYRRGLETVRLGVEAGIRRQHCDFQSYRGERANERETHDFPSIERKVYGDGGRYMRCRSAGNIGALWATVLVSIINITIVRRRRCHNNLIEKPGDVFWVFTSIEVQG